MELQGFLLTLEQILFRRQHFSAKKVKKSPKTERSSISVFGFLHEYIYMLLKRYGIFRHLLENAYFQSVLLQNLGVAHHVLFGK